MGSKRLLMLFVRNPELGKVKTRLAKDLGEEQALSIYLHLLRHTRAITKDMDAAKLVYYAEKVQQHDLWDESIYQKKVQPEGDLGDKMKFAFATAFEEGFEQVLIIGSDCYQLDQAILEQAFKALEKYDVVIGPAKDGGYYLLGMKKLHPALFENKNWSTSTVFQDTLQDIREQELTYTLLPELSDVDRAEDVDSALLLHCSGHE